MNETSFCLQFEIGVEGLRLESVIRWMVVCCGVWPDCSCKYGK